MDSPTLPTAYVVTGPTSGIGYQTALLLAEFGRVVLIGRNATKLADVKAAIEHKGGHAVSIVCDMANLASVRQAAAEIGALPFSIAGVVNNAGIMLTRVLKTAAGWDATFATNYLGPIALVEAVEAHLPDGANIVFIGSAIEDPGRAPARVMGMKGGRFISVEASAAGQWLGGGARIPGIDAYATSKQCILAAALGLARENPRLRFNVVEPGINPGTGLGGVHNPALGFLFGQVLTRLPPFAQYRSTPTKAAAVVCRVLTDHADATGIYFDEKGQPMRGSDLAHDPRFQDQLLAETRAFLAAAG